ncbi:hypothetical protein C8D92_109158 [Tamilnaduibacter salinus]|uniref:Uncharacterized protein n=1 Tax=Tamilnaduibacter salinus TaxID=1484056 RepID=A0A2U1CU95_9GAMM|nr:hypothetical protein C8D92_109158 [Tamilnaduibacter salinus]
MLGIGRNAVNLVDTRCCEAFGVGVQLRALNRRFLWTAMGIMNSSQYLRSLL